MIGLLGGIAGAAANRWTGRAAAEGMTVRGGATRGAGWGR